MTAPILGGSTPVISTVRFGVLIVGWYLATLVSNMSGKAYVKETLDAMSPTSVSMACAGVVLAAKQLFSLRNAHKEDVFVPNKNKAMSGRSTWAYHRWAMGLGFIQFLATALSYSSFALSSVTWTYCFRTLEPLISAVLQFAVAGIMTSKKELGALMVLAVGIVITVNSNSGGQTYAAWLGALALSATVIYSCRSVIGSRVMKWYGRSGADMFILASTYGCAFSIWLHLCLHFLGFGSSVPLTIDRIRQLIVAGSFHCVYNMMSFQILHILQPVAHGVCNTMKRVFMVVMSAILSGHMLSGVQLLGVMVANLAAGVYGFESKRRAEKEKEHALRLNVEEVIPLSGYNAHQGSHSMEAHGDGDDHNSHNTKNTQGQIGWKLIWVGSIATIVGILFLLVSLHALELRSGSTPHSGVDVNAGGATGTTEVDPNVEGKEHKAMVLEDSLAHQQHESSRLKCLVDIRDRINTSLNSILQNFGSPLVLIEFTHPLQGFGVNLLGALAATSTQGRTIDSICVLSDTNFNGSLECKGAKFLNKSDGAQIILGGGSSWGDADNSTRAFRLGLLSSLDSSHSDKHHILQLPTSLSYEHLDLYEYEKQILKELPNLYFLARDHLAAEEAKSVLPENVSVDECPDIVFHAEILPSTEPATVDVVLLLKSGVSSVDSWAELEQAMLENKVTWEVVAWPEPLEYTEEEAQSILEYAERIAKTEVDLISKGTILVTDDVKAAMLAVLVGKIHILVDSEDDGSLATTFDAIANVSPNCTSQNLHQLRVNSLVEAIHKCISIAHQ